MSEICIRYKGETLPLSDDELNWILTCVDTVQDNMDDLGDGLKPFLSELNRRLFRLVEAGRIQEEVNYG